MRQVINPISRYMIASYAYYVEDEPIMSDSEYDNLCKNLLEHWDTLVEPSDHPHKNLLCKDALEAGTYLGKYPTIIKNALKNYRLYAYK